MISLFPFYTLFQIVAIILPQSELMWQAINNNCPAISGKTFALCFNFSCAPQLYGGKGGARKRKWREDVQCCSIFNHFTPPGILQPEPRLSGLNTSTNQLPWTLALKNICLLLIIWPNLFPPFKTRSIAMESRRHESLQGMKIVPSLIELSQKVCPRSTAAWIGESGVKDIKHYLWSATCPFYYLSNL